MQRTCQRILFSILFLGLSIPCQGMDDRVEYPGGTGPGAGKHIVLISGDEEYRSEEALPQLGKILSARHGFRCTVLFALDDDGTINPKRTDNIPGLETLASADLALISLRFRNLPDEQMKHFVDYVEAGKPIVALRTSTHAFNIKGDSRYAAWSYNSKSNFGDRPFTGGFGRQVLGETWINHHGAHGKQSTRGIIAPGAERHPILKGIADGDIWGPTDVYGITNLPGDSRPLVLGQVLVGMQPDDAPLEGPKNDPMMPIAWTKTYTGGEGKAGRVFTTTMGAATDLTREGTRRMIVNACYWAVGLEAQIPAKSDVGLVGNYQPTPFRFDGFVKGVKPRDHVLAP